MAEQTRPKLNLAPRSAAPAATSAPASGKPSPFGAARPREAVIATRTGVSEAEVLKQDAATYVPKLRLNKQDAERKEALEEELASAKKEAADSADADSKAAALKAVAAAEEELKVLMSSVEVRADANA